MTDFRQVWCLHAYSGGTVRDSHPVFYSPAALLPHPQALKWNINLPIEYHRFLYLSIEIRPVSYVRRFPFRSVSLPDPLVPELRKISGTLDDIIAKAQHAKEAAEDVLEKIDLLKKSILARAFRGELGTNDPTEESALELLKRVI